MNISTGELRKQVDEMVKDRADWLVDAVACATQNRMFLRGEQECDAVACGAIQMNGDKALRHVMDNHPELLAARAKLEAAGRLVEAAWEHDEAFSVLEDSVQIAAREKLEAALAAWEAAQ